jgi:DNA repair exonuclease SbcCD ATPase subunit
MRVDAMTCEEAESRLEAWALGFLDSGDRETLNQHLAGCAPCSRIAREVQGLLGRLEGLPRQNGEAAEFVDRILRHTPESLRRLADVRTKWRLGLTLAASVFILVSVALLSFGVGASRSALSSKNSAWERSLRSRVQELERDLAQARLKGQTETEHHDALRRSLAQTELALVEAEKAAAQARAESERFRNDSRALEERTVELKAAREEIVSLRAQLVSLRPDEPAERIHTLEESRKALSLEMAILRRAKEEGDEKLGRLERRFNAVFTAGPPDLPNRPKEKSLAAQLADGIGQITRIR